MLAMIGVEKWYVRAFVIEKNVSVIDNAKYLKLYSMSL